KGWAILLRQKQKKLIMLPSETMIWQPEFTDKTLSRKPGAVQMYREWLKTTSPSMRQVHKAGEKLFVDYCGPTVGVTDPETGEI
ncbi:IS21 family transposase, partial [Escherichia coli]|nr:IS21 family transposase [Escherichia coli]